MALYLGTISDRKVIPFTPDLDGVKSQLLALAGKNTDDILIEVYPDPDATVPCPIMGIRYDAEVGWVTTA